MGLSNATFGLVGGFIVLPLPQMLAAEGVSEARIAAVSAACLSPGFWVFLLGPLLDVRFSRRWYASVFAGLAGVGLMMAVLMRGHLLVLEIALMTAYAAAVLSSNALGGWLAGIVPDVAETEHDNPSHKGASLSAWTQVGSYLGNGLMAGLAAEGLRLLPLNVAAVLLGALVVLPAAVFPWIPQPVASEKEPSQQRVWESLAGLLRELKALLKKREVLLTVLLFVAPTGAFALTNQLGGVAREFHASDAFVSRMGGAVLSLAGAASCLLLPVLARWVKALPLYLLIGTVGSLFTLSLQVLPKTPTTFAVAFLAENVMQALSFTAAVAICFATIGRDNPLAATQFSLLTSATVLPILYMAVVDGRAYSGFHSIRGLGGMYAIDGGLSLAACCVMAAVMWRRPRAHKK
ncbi:MFS transporter [Granulicella arctica]|uniref:PAT family beta-lactamase induction signal transducer AmpG n=1 Tax=Granulicella arctica TaxID=940613 RepID=A0A7Y9PEE2_9BACT|nr:MFS transporter [Granulicella arctica]NYF78165.1 PAT family beta-lactamase induction signal transducer AmpG [Granulicella arctica]